MTGIDQCICDAKWSGLDEAEYCARGCPNCICGKGSLQGRSIYLLRQALPFLSDHQDEGPWGAGWKSQQLLSLINDIEKITSKK